MISLQNDPAHAIFDSCMSIERLIPFLGQSMKKRREQLGLSLQHVADSTGLSAEYIAFVETGGTNFSMRTLKTIAEALRMAPSQLIRSAEELFESEKK
ncbi:MAG TPA: helix-turn-helix transcriptional regulator [Candidatus Obscuribacterales bacterium]